jgi:hypothetical protein
MPTLLFHFAELNARLLCLIYTDILDGTQGVLSTASAF